MLYASIGDGRITANLAQNRGALAGKILRLDPRGGAADGNPYGNAVWSYGHRNPQGLAFRADGQLFAMEHGPGCRDELNRIMRGGNYGWTGDQGCPPAFPAGSIREIKAYTPTTTIAPSGASFYTGTGVPAWTGSLFFTTLKTQSLWRVTLSDDGRTVVSDERLYAGRFGRLRDVQQASDGSLWLTTDDGRVLRLRGTASPASALGPVPTAPCSVPATVQLASSTITATAPAAAQVRGTAGALVDVRAYTRPSTTYRMVRTVRLDAAGRVPISVLPPANTRLLAQERGCADGPSVVLNVRTALTLTAVRTGVRSYVFRGDSLPARRGGLIVSLYRTRADGSRVLTAQARAHAVDGQWRISRQFTGSGRFGFVAITGQDLRNAPGRSSERPTVIF